VALGRDYHRESASVSQRFYVAMICYAAIALLAWLTLDGNLRLIVWIILGGLALKTYLHTLRKP